MEYVMRNVSMNLLWCCGVHKSRKIIKDNGYIKTMDIFHVTTAEQEHKTMLMPFDICNEHLSTNVIKYPKACL